MGGAATRAHNICPFIEGFNAARGFVGGAASQSVLIAQMWLRFNAARGFVGGAATTFFAGIKARDLFQCRTRLCGWCSRVVCSTSLTQITVSMPHAALWVVQHKMLQSAILWIYVSMPHAALWVVQRRRRGEIHIRDARRSFNAARGFVGGAASSLAALVPLGRKSPFGKSPEI